MLKQHNIPRATRNYVRNINEMGNFSFYNWKNNSVFVKSDCYGNYLKFVHSDLSYAFLKKNWVFTAMLLIFYGKDMPAKKS